MARSLPGYLLLSVALLAACGRTDGAGSAGTSDSARPATAASARPDTAQARQAVLALETELFRSYVRGDTAPAARILAADYMGFSGDGMRETKAQALANAHRDASATAGTVDSIHVDSTIVHAYGDAVVAQATGTFAAHDRRQAGTIAFRNTDVFVWRDGRWQLVATHLSKPDQPQGRVHPR